MEEAANIAGNFRFRLNRKGMARVLGPREAEVMECIWHLGPSTVADVHDRIRQRQPVAYTTIMTIMGRLRDKGILTRWREGNSYVYSAAVSKEEMVQSLVGRVVDGLLQEFSAPAMAYFVRRLSQDDEETLAEVERIIAERKASKGR